MNEPIHRTNEVVARFLSNDANMVMCVRAEDYDRVLSGLRAAMKYLPHEIREDITAYHLPTNVAHWTGEYQNDLADMRVAYRNLTALRESPGA